MSTREPGRELTVVPEPSYLPPNPSVGELATEIDRARHDLARTVNALVGKLDVKATMKRRTHDQVESLRWNGRRVAADLRAIRIEVLESVPSPVADGLAAAGRVARRVPPQGWFAIVLGLLLLRKVRHR
jgi:hypothetical protein